MESKKLQSDKRRSWSHLLAILGMFFAIEVLSFGDIVEIIPPFAPMLDSSLFSFFHEIHNLLATAAILFATYKYGARLGITAIAVYLAIHVIYFIIQSDEWPENAMEITHVLLSVFVSFVGIWLINRLRNSEKRLGASEERYRSTLENMIEGCQIIGFDWRYLYVNESAAKHGRRTREELLGHTMMEVYPGIENTEMFANLQRCLEKHIPHHMENQFTYPDGSQGWFELRIEPVPDGIFILSLDITERKQAEETLRISEENFRHSMDDSPLGIRIINADGETIYVNRALLDIYGFDSLEEFRATPGKKVYTPESYAEHRKRVEKRQRGEYVPSSYEISIVSKDGKIRHLEVIRKDVLRNGKPQFQMLYRDITEVNQLQEQLIMQDRLASIGQLVSGVAHELNNPLTSVIGFSELLLQRELPDDVKADLKIVNDEAKRTSLIVRNLLTFARQQPQEKRAIDINEPIQTVLQLRSHEQSTNNIKLDTHLAPDLPQIIGNGSQLQQVFLNIITNAEFAMLEAHNKGTLTVTTKQQGNFVRTSFTDDGHGIPRENMARLFSPFFTTKEPSKGTGLGLSICQGIVTEHGGRIWAKSEPDKGATFIIELPVYKSPQEEKSK